MSVKFEDYYKTLGVDKTATPKQIQQAFRRLARKYHPDVNKKPEAAAQFKKINEAYEVLKDPDKRSRYDQLGANWKAGQDFTPPPGFENMRFHFAGRGNGHGFHMHAGGQFSDFFDAFFGPNATGQPFAGFGGAGHQTRRQSPPTQEANLSLTLEEAHHGVSRQLTLQRPGSGSAGGSVRRLDVKIPPGTRDGSKIRLKGQADQGADLILNITLAPHERFEVRDANLTMELPISASEAALGAKVPVQTLTGSVMLNIPPGSASGTRLRLAGQGLSLKPGQDQRGDLFVRLKIVVPKKLTDEQRKLFEQLRDAGDFDPRA